MKLSKTGALELLTKIVEIEMKNGGEQRYDSSKLARLMQVQCKRSALVAFAEAFDVATCCARPACDKRVKAAVEACVAWTAAMHEKAQHTPTSSALH